MSFSSEYQGGSFVDLVPSGSNPLGSWKSTGPQKSIQKVYDKDTKGFIHQSTSGGGGARLAIPKDEKAALGLLQPFLVLQVNLPQGQALTLELGISDAAGTRRRVLLSSSFTDVKATPLHCQVPIHPLVRDGWLNLVLALGEMVPVLFRGATFRQLDAIAISGGGCKLRKVFTLKNVSDQVGSDLILPRGLEFPPGLPVATQLLGTSSLGSMMILGGGGSGNGARSAAASTTPTSTLQRRGGGTKVLAVKVDHSSDDDEGSGVGGVRSISGIMATASGQGGGTWATGQDHLPSTRLAGRPLAAAGVAGGGGGVSRVSEASSSGGGAALPPGAQFSSGRRAISAQTVLRDEDGLLLPGGGGGAGGGAGGLIAGLNGRPGVGGIGTGGGNGHAGNASRGLNSSLAGGGSQGVTGAFKTPASPPYPKATYSQRTQSGPARMGEDSMLLPSPSTPSSSSAAVDPGTPKHGRRSVMAMAAAGRNIPSTISEAEPLRSSDEAAEPSNRGAAAAAGGGGGHYRNGGAGGNRLPPPAASSGSGVGKGSPVKAGGGGAGLPSPGGRRGAAAGGGEPALGSLLQVKASVDSSLDFSAMARAGLMAEDITSTSASRGGGGGAAALGSSPPLVSNMFSLMGSVPFPGSPAARDRYASFSSPTSEKANAAVSSVESAGKQQRAPPSNQRPAAPAENMSRPRMGGEGPPGGPVVGGGGGGLATTSGRGKAVPPSPARQGSTNSGASVGGGTKGGGNGRAVCPGRGGARGAAGGVTALSEASASAAVGVMPSKAMTPTSRTRPLLPPPPAATTGQAHSTVAASAGKTGLPQQAPQVNGSSAVGGSHSQSPSKGAAANGRGSSPSLGQRRGAPTAAANGHQQQQQGKPPAAAHNKAPAMVAATHQWSNDRHNQLIQQRKSEASRNVSHVNSITAASEVEEDLALDAWDGFGIDEEDVLGSRHFRRSGAGGAAGGGGTKRPSHGGVAVAAPLMMAGGAAANGSVTQQPVPCDSPRGPNGINGLAQIRTKVAAPQHRALQHNVGLLEGLGSPMATAVASPPMRRVAPGGNGTGSGGGAGPSNLGGAAAPFGRAATRPSHDLDDAVLQGEIPPPGASISAGVPSKGSTARPSPLAVRQQQHQGAASRLGVGGGGSGQSDGGHHTNTTVDALLGATGGRGGGGRGLMDDDDDDVLLGRRRDSPPRGGGGRGGRGGGRGAFGGGGGGSWGRRGRVGEHRPTDAPDRRDDGRRGHRRPPGLPAARLHAAHRAAVKGGAAAAGGGGGCSWPSAAPSGSHSGSGRRRRGDGRPRVRPRAQVLL